MLANMAVPGTASVLKRRQTQPMAGGHRIPPRGQALVRYQPPRPARRFSLGWGWRRRPGRRRTLADRFLGFAGRVFVGLAFLVLFAFTALYIKLSFAPISMTFLAEPVERAVNRALPGMTFNIGDAVLRTSETGIGIEFRLADVSLLDETGGRIVESPMASADVSLRALLTGHLAVGEVELIGPSLFLQYSEDKGLALSFGDPRESKTDLGAPYPQAASGQHVREVVRRAQTPAASPPPRHTFNPHARARAINLTKAFNDIFAAARRGESAYLTTFGIRDAVVHFDRGNQVTSWEVPAAEIDLEHAGRNSAVLGKVSLKTATGQSQMQFRASINRRSQQLALALSFDDVVPRDLARDLPALSLAKSLNLPVSLAADLELAGNGDILSGDIKVSLKNGELYAPWDDKHPAAIDQGAFRVAYSREKGLIEFKPSELRWDGSHIAFSGAMERQPATGHWLFRLASDSIALGAEEFGVPVIPLDRLLLQGAYQPSRGIIALDRFFLQAADAQIALSGSVVQGPRTPAVKLNGRISRMPVAFAKLIWPPFMAAGARDWVGERVPAGRIAGGTVKIDIAADMLADAAEHGLPPSAVDFRLDLEALKVHYIPKLPPLLVPRATASITGHRFFFVVPESDIQVPSGDRVHFTDGELIIGDLRPRVPTGEIHFKSQASAAAMVELINHPPLGYVDAVFPKTPDISGDGAATFSLSMPFIKELKFKDMKLNGRTHVENIRAMGLPGGVGVHGGKLDIDTTEKAIEIRGEVKVNGTPVTVAWQRIFDASPEHQPPLRLRAVMDEAARREAGLETDHILRGNVLSELTLRMRKDAPPRLHFEANLTETDILLSSMGWRKPPGQRAVLNVDIDTDDGGGMALKNLNLLGDDLAVRGMVFLNEKRKPVSFSFPTVTLNAQTKLEMRGELKSGNIWDVRVSGPSFDGRQFFRSLFSAGKLTEDQPQLPDDAPGMDVKAQIETVVGHYDTSAKKVWLEARRRGSELVYLDMHGSLADEPVAARVDAKKGEPRILQAMAGNAGAAFRLVGLYSAARGGAASLKVNLDGSKKGDKVGYLYARRFAIINTPMANSARGRKGRRPARSREIEQQQAQYERMDFDEMRVRFGIGHGRFKLGTGILNGPMMGINVRGYIDFQREVIDLTGVYTPAFGLNAPFSGVPLLGDILSSRDGEGLIGITFAVRGPLSQPDVQINPASLLTPGMFRQMMEFDQSVQDILPPEKQGAARRRSGSPPPTR